MTKSNQNLVGYLRKKLINRAVIFLLCCLISSLVFVASLFIYQYNTLIFYAVYVPIMVLIVVIMPLNNIMKVEPLNMVTFILPADIREEFLADVSELSNEMKKDGKNKLYIFTTILLNAISVLYHSLFFKFSELFRVTHKTQKNTSTVNEVKNELTKK